MAANHKVIETFTIAGKGVVAAIDELLSFNPGQAIHVVIHRPDGSSVSATAFPELMLRRLPTPFERSAFLLPGLEAAAVPVGSVIELKVESAPVAAP